MEIVGTTTMNLLTQAPAGALSATHRCSLKFTHPIPPLFTHRRPNNITFPKPLTLTNAWPGENRESSTATSTSTTSDGFSGSDNGSGSLRSDEPISFVGQDSVPLEGVIQFEKPDSSSLSDKINKWGWVALLAGGDVAALLLFSAIGRFSHGFSVFDPDTLRTADPFVAGWFLSAYFLGGFGEDGRGKNGLFKAFIAATQSWSLGIPIRILGVQGRRSSSIIITSNSRYIAHRIQEFAKMEENLQTDCSHGIKERVMPSLYSLNNGLTRKRKTNWHSLHVKGCVSGGSQRQLSDFFPYVLALVDKIMPTCCWWKVSDVYGPNNNLEMSNLWLVPLSSRRGEAARRFVALLGCFLTSDKLLEFKQLIEEENLQKIRDLVDCKRLLAWKKSLFDNTVGLAIRAATVGHIPPINFIIVTMGSTAVLLIGWRTLLFSILPMDKPKKNDIYKSGGPFEFLEVKFLLSNQ
ncbi:putative growth-regulating factor 6-like [Capsicum annuum]|nr:putative growth-regulating factor 6-like [Capsicum annuum]